MKIVEVFVSSIDFKLDEDYPHKKSLRTLEKAWVNLGIRTDKGRAIPAGTYYLKLKHREKLQALMEEIATEAEGEI